MAIASTERLASWWGEHDFIVSRLIHLKHNLMRVEAASGAVRDAIERGARLLEHIAAVSTGQSPSTADAPTEGRLDDRVAGIHFDLVTETLSELFVTVSAEDARSALSSLRLPEHFDLHDGWRGLQWLALKSAALRAAPRRFLVTATSFLRAGRGTTPALWYAVALDLMQLLCVLDPESTSEDIMEIRAELTAGARVPACMRAAAARRSG